MIEPLRSKYQIKVSLQGWSPPIWRRLSVPSNITLDKLHLVIQHAMGWENCHLHHFKHGGLTYERSEDYVDLSNDGFGEYNSRDESKYKLSQILKHEKEHMFYEYDFGDSWAHRVLLEKILPYDLGSKEVQCIAGKRACPPEDCGGLYGYQNLLSQISDTSHSEHKYAVEWLGECFDYQFFDIESTNKLLKRCIKQYT